MSQHKKIEIMVGGFVTLILCSLLFLAFQVGGLKHYTQNNATYLISADFDNVGQLKQRAPVRLGGVLIGRVKSIHLNPKTFKADVTLAINKTQKNLPSDSSLSILTEGLLGSHYIALSPGYSETTLKEGDHIEETHSALILERIVGELIYHFKSSSHPSQPHNFSTPKESHP